MLDPAACVGMEIEPANSPATFVAQPGTLGSYGTFAIDAAGAWSYTASSAHNEFAAGTTYTDTFDVASADGTHTSVTAGAPEPASGRESSPALLSPILTHTSDTLRRWGSKAADFERPLLALEQVVDSPPVDLYAVDAATVPGLGILE